MLRGDNEYYFEYIKFEAPMRQPSGDVKDELNLQTVQIRGLEDTLGLEMPFFLVAEIWDLNLNGI